MPDRSTRLKFEVLGTPVAQPRHRATCRGGFARMYLPSDHAVHAWKDSLATAAFEQCKQRGQLEGAVRVWFYFYFSTAKAGQVGTARISKPDIDNLAKAALDALTEAGVWADDAQVASLICEKRHSNHPRVVVQIESMTD